MNEIIYEIRKALADRMWNAAIALSLILPDICCKVENHRSPNYRVPGIEYEKWFDQHVVPLFSDTPLLASNFTGHVCWILRCHMLHSGNADDLPTPRNLDRIEILIPDDITASSLSIIYVESDSATTVDRTLSVNLNQLCTVMAKVAEDFYNGWGVKSDFEGHTLRYDTKGSQMLRNFQEMTLYS